VYWEGPQGNQAQFSGRGISSLLGLHEQLDDEAVDLRWVVRDDYAVVYAEE